MTEASHLVELDCARCGRATLHEVTYAGRILVSSTCTECGATMRRGGTDLRSSYLHDLEHRLVTKPRRMLARAAGHPVDFLRSLPAAIARQPGKVLTELRAILRR